MDARGIGTTGGYDPYSAISQGWQNRLGGLSSFLGGVLNDPRKAYANAERAYDPWSERASNAFNPFVNAGEGAIGPYQNWLSQMSNPVNFLNNLSSQYQESPYAKYLQQQVQRAGTNAASASGLIGSTPFLQQSQENAENISSRDMQNWLSQVLGLNTQYGQGWGNLIGTGLQAAGGQSNVFGQRAADEAALAYGKEAAGQSRNSNIIGGLLKFLF